MGNCVGKRNYRYFYLMIATITLLCIYILAFSVVHIILGNVSFGIESEIPSSLEAKAIFLSFLGMERHFSLF